MALVGLLLVLGSVTAMHKDYCLIGAGPGGLTLARLLHHAGRDYVLFERAPSSGSFFSKYPRHRVLLSGGSEELRLPGMDELPVRGDQADAYVSYLEGYSEGLNILYETEALVSRQKRNGAGRYRVTTRGGSVQEYSCDVVVVATGLSVPRVPDPHMVGAELLEEYGDMPTDPANFTNQSVTILGNGQSSFETAMGMADTASQVWIVGRQRVRLAMETRYSGDVQAKANGLLDSYQLKSLDAVVEHPFSTADTALIHTHGKLKFMSPKIAERF
eukprot:TRINITY_DN51252_c0_g1_i1.p1 TRINITY_DN51252_c0_g1~~TRINITY_DN51252_c0_g1_i1.p1  ORF type:complete len:273 (+),score=69.37 TRINITY_DN51252_c0_g1_i1:3-821(+)